MSKFLMSASNWFVRSLPPRSDSIFASSACVRTPSLYAFASPATASIGFTMVPVACAAFIASSEYVQSTCVRLSISSFVHVTPSSSSVSVSPIIFKMRARAAVAALVPDSWVTAVIVPSIAISWSMDMFAIDATFATMGNPSEIFSMDVA